jgi:hypothetical protein
MPCQFDRNINLSKRFYFENFKDTHGDFLGTISYSLYLWQELFAANLGDFFGSNKILEQPLLILAMAISSFYLIERPSIRMGRRVIQATSARISTRRTAKMAPPPASPELTVKGELAPE